MLYVAIWYVSIRPVVMRVKEESCWITYILQNYTRSIQYQIIIYIFISKLLNNNREEFILMGHVARMGRGERHTGFCWGNLRERYHLEDLGVDRMIILIRIFRKCYVEACTVSIWLRIGTGGGHL